MALALNLEQLRKVKTNYDEHVETLKKYLNELNSAIGDLSGNIPDHLRNDLNRVQNSYDEYLKALIQDATNLATFIGTQIQGYSSAVSEALQKIEAVLSKMNSCYLVSDVAKEVINGRYGSGQERAAALTAQGYDAATVQKMVNAEMRGDPNRPDNGGLFGSDSITPFTKPGSDNITTTTTEAATPAVETTIATDPNAPTVAEDPVPVTTVPDVHMPQTTSPTVSAIPANSIAGAAAAGATTVAGAAVKGVQTVAKGIAPIVGTYSNIVNNGSQFGKVAATLANPVAAVAVSTSPIKTILKTVGAVRTGGLSLLTNSKNKTVSTIANVASGGLGWVANSSSPAVRILGAIATGGLSLAFKNW